MESLLPAIRHGPPGAAQLDRGGRVPQPLPRTAVHQFWQAGWNTRTGGGASRTQSLRPLRSPTIEERSSSFVAVSSCPQKLRVNLASRVREGMKRGLTSFRLL